MSNDNNLDWGLLDDTVGPRLRLLRNALVARSIAASKPFNLPTGSLTVLSLIEANPASSQSLIAGKAGIATPALVGIIDHLEGEGLVSRIRSTTDRRRNDIVLTDKGQETMSALFDEVKHIETPIRQALGPRDYAAFCDMLERAIGSLGAD